MPEPSGVSREEHEMLLRRLAELEDRVKREQVDNLPARVHSLETAMESGREVAEEDLRNVYRSIQVVYGHLNRLHQTGTQRFVQYDDKIEELDDQMTAVSEELRSMRERLVALDDATMKLEDRMASSSDSEEPTSSQDVPEQRPDGNKGEAIADRAVNEDIATWTAQVEFLPLACEVAPFEVGSQLHRRCKSRGLVRDLTFQDGTSDTFRRVVEKEFDHVLSGRAWTPLRCRALDQTSSGAPIASLSRPVLSQQDYKIWNASFLSKYCVQVEKPSCRRRLFISFKDVAMTWKQVRSLPQVGAPDEQCWEGDGETNEQLPRGQQVEVGRPSKVMAMPPPRRTRRSLSASSSVLPAEISKKRTLSGTFPTSPGHAHDEQTKRVRVHISGQEGQLYRLEMRSSSAALV